MFKNLFGRRDKAEKAAPGNLQIGEAPWGTNEGATVTSAFALISLRDYIMSDLKGPRGVHSETALTMIGALAGFSAQHAIWETVVKTGKLPVSGIGPAFDDGAFVLVETKTSETFYFGNLLNSYLVPTDSKLATFGPGPFTLWSILAGVVIKCGGKPVSAEEYGEIFRNVGATVGTARFGEPRLPKNHQSSMTPRNALNRAWPHARKILKRDDIPGFEGRSLEIGYWPTVIAMTASALIEDAKSVLDPKLAMRIVLEAAIPMSKVDPKTVP